MSIILQQTSTWPGFTNIKYMTVFGDSYSSVGYSISRHPHPTHSNPLGIPFPGHTYATQRQTWIHVSHLVTKYSPETNYLEGTKHEGFTNLVPDIDHGPSGSSLVAFDFGKGGSTISEVRSLISRFDIEAADVVGKLFEDHESLYATGARNFLFIDVPPIARSPAARGQFFGPIHSQWNEALNERAQQNLVGSHPTTQVHDILVREISEFLDSVVKSSSAK
ncbi:carbohydrate esterase family 16 protein [Paxillus rubicundulus Ve08.2h10]|uniref:Carbohydrate esterase family 16 protein n=1 Tax=Paxillus rubicundulus Ve08.2h10 TaxID=930991 RepID=A0A0D0ECP2_9AGAM|nr:carbohydrate esterase family 16 protein [Paxillus rubicundulus Ve08.2h10]